MWQPTAPLANLQARATILEKVRAFFKMRDVLEVDTPILGQAPVTDPYLEALQTKTKSFPGKTFYLQTSPEYYQKRLIAAYGMSTYQITKCFRDDEYGRIHSPEFSMLEWYRIGFDDVALMDEVEELLQSLTAVKIKRLSYRNAFQTYLNIDPHHVPLQELQQAAAQFYQGEMDRDLALQILMSEVVEKELAKLDMPVFIYDFPASQAALAQHKTLEDGTVVGARFELYWRGVELGNGYHELTDASEQQQRFSKDLANRERLNLPIVPIDTNLLAALEEGNLPPCAGIAMGLDRLIMVILAQDSLAKVQSFFEF